MNNSLGNKIRQYRKSKALTQEQLAELIGIDNKHLSRIEKGKHLPTYNIVRKLAKVLDFDIYALEEISITEIPQTNKQFLKALSILNSAQNEEEIKYYSEILNIAQKGLKLHKFVEKKATITK